MVEARYDETIAHEVCHAYQRALYPKSTWHGEFFLYLLQEVCGFTDAKTTHSDYRPAVLKALRLSYQIHAASHLPPRTDWLILD